MKRYIVKLNCPTGTWRLEGWCWTGVRHTITWASYDSLQEAVDAAEDLVRGMRYVHATVVEARQETALVETTVYSTV